MLEAADGLASVIVPCADGRARTRLCLDAVLRHTRPPYELIVVDDGTTDGTSSRYSFDHFHGPLPYQTSSLGLATSAGPYFSTIFLATFWGVAGHSAMSVATAC